MKDNFVLLNAITEVQAKRIIRFDKYIASAKDC